MQDAIDAATVALGLTHVEPPFAQGGQKVVCRGHRGGAPVVLKVVQLDAATDPNALERCKREVSLLKDLSSPHLVKLESDLAVLGPNSEAAAWLEEELDGEDLRALVGQQWSWQDVVEMLRGVGAGLSVMHEQGYIHRDLSGGNVRRTQAGVWKVMDPGFAKHLDRSTITGVFQPGTPGFMSPEHVSPGGRVTPASDVFCLGILAHLALTGNVPVPFAGDPVGYRQALLGPRPSVSVRRPDLDPDQAAIVDRCLTVQPARRYLDATELLDEIGVPSTGGN